MHSDVYVFDLLLSRKCLIANLLHKNSGGGYRHDARDKRDLSLDLKTGAAPVYTTLAAEGGFFQRIKDLFTFTSKEPCFEDDNVYRARTSNVSLRWMVQQASKANIRFSYESIYGAASPLALRPELLISPHGSYLHFTHPDIRSEYAPHKYYLDAIDHADLPDLNKEDPKNALIRQLVEDAANLDALSLEDLEDQRELSRVKCVLLDLSTQVHESRDLAYKLLP